MQDLRLRGLVSTELGEIAEKYGTPLYVYSAEREAILSLLGINVSGAVSRTTACVSSSPAVIPRWRWRIRLP